MRSTMFNTNTLAKICTATIKIDEFASDNVEPVSAKIAVTKFDIVMLPHKNDNMSDMNAIRIDLIASRVPET